MRAATMAPLHTVRGVVVEHRNNPLANRIRIGPSLQPGELVAALMHVLNKMDEC